MSVTELYRQHTMQAPEPTEREECAECVCVHTTTPSTPFISDVDEPIFFCVLWKALAAFLAAVCHFLSVFNS